MKHKNEIHSLIYVKDNTPKIIPRNSQTEILRDQTNKSIKELGNMYYQIKNILERINIRRDALYDIGKRLEEEYKRLKFIKPLKAKQRRMKDSLYCWYAENFYYEMIQPNSFFIEKIKQYNSQNGLSKNISEFPENVANIDNNNQILIYENEPQRNEIFYVFNNFTNIYLISEQ